MMHRTQILLEQRQYAALRAWAKRTDRSLSEAVRLAVDRLLGAGQKGRPGARLADICGMFSDPGGVAGRDHDSYLYGGAKDQPAP
ncbi:MAG: hypothetical protein NTY77_01785 [Elusimicrobia bacterium]|nr:hypothetical protein [Elusimicrobiota bacterium]